MAKWLLIQFTLYQTITLPKWMFSQNLLFKSSLLLKGLCGIQVNLPTSSDYLCLLFCIHTTSMSILVQAQSVRSAPISKISYKCCFSPSNYIFLNFTGIATKNTPKNLGSVTEYGIIGRSCSQDLNHYLSCSIIGVLQEPLSLDSVSAILVLTTGFLILGFYLFRVPAGKAAMKTSN